MGNGAPSAIQHSPFSIHDSASVIQMLEFVRRNRIVLTSGSLLLVSLLLLSVGTRARQRIDPLTGVVLEGMRPLQAAVSAGVDATAHVWRTYLNLVGVTQENELLRRRVLALE